MDFESMEELCFSGMIYEFVDALNLKPPVRVPYFVPRTSHRAVEAPVL